LLVSAGYCPLFGIDDEFFAILAWSGTLIGRFWQIKSEIEIVPSPLLVGLPNICVRGSELRYYPPFAVVTIDPKAGSLTS